MPFEVSTLRPYLQGFSGHFCHFQPFLTRYSRKSLIAKSALGLSAGGCCVRLVVRLLFKQPVMRYYRRAVMEIPNAGYVFPLISPFIVCLCSFDKESGSVIRQKSRGEIGGRTLM